MLIYGFFGVKTLTKLKRKTHKRLGIKRLWVVKGSWNRI